MAQVVVNENEIYLGTTFFPIVGYIRPYLVSTWPGKVVFGDYSKDSEQLASNWLISDQRGGILVEEMDETIHLDRCWWSTCNLSHKGHIILPPLSTEVALPVDPSPTLTDGGFETWTDSTTLTNWTDDGNLTQGTAKTGSYSASLNGTTSEILLYQDISDYAASWNGRKFTFAGFYYLGAATTAYVGISDDGGTTKTWSAGGTTLGAWTAITVSKVLSSSATGLRVYCRRAADAGDDYAAFDDMTLTFAGTTATAPATWCNFNSKLYVGFGTALAKLNSAGDGWDGVYEFDAAITALISSIGNNLYVFLGDADNYWYMSTAEAFTETNVADATKGVHWDTKLFKMDSAGQLASATAPNSATPTWTNKGDLGDEGLADNDVQELFIYRDADGEPIVYAATKVGLFAHDFSNAKWVETELALPNHPNCGKGVVWWRDALYVSAGLDVIKYIAARTATISFVGLSRDDGLISEYRGEIVKFIKGYNDFFASIDATQVTGTGYSGVYKYDGMGWQALWVTGTADKAMNSGIVSSVYAYRLWFDHNDKVNYIPLQRDIRNPLQISTYTYAVSGAHITPWFDANTAHTKVALKIKTDCDSITTTETVTVKYRINHANTDLDTGWTTLVTLDTTAESGEVTTDFGSDAGIEFRSIQFRFDLARGSTNTLTPDILKFNLVYLKTLDTLWGWGCTVDCSQEHKGNKPAQLDAALKTIIDTKTLSDFTFRDESGGTYSYKVRVARCQGLERTGENWRNKYSVELVAP